MKQIKTDALKINLAINELIAGLMTDGAHHKQYYMEQALKALSPGDYEDFKQREKWEDGIPN